MGLSSLQVCMDSSDWINQGVNHQEENGIDSSSSSPSSTTDHEEKRAARPQNEQQAIIIKCPRCDSTHTKFCYYNNYSLSQPRYFCKTCRRYWTKGGSLRNIPVGGGCRKKNKSVISTKKSYANSDPTGGLHLTFPNLLANSETLGMTNFMERGYSYNAMLENSSRQVDHLLESKLDALLGNSSRRNHDFMGTNDLGFLGGGGGCGDEGGTSHGFTHNYFHGLCSPPFEDESNNGSFLPPFQGSEMKPNKQNYFSLDWQHNGGAEVGKDSIGYLDGIGSWNAIMNGYGCSQQCD